MTDEIEKKEEPVQSGDDNTTIKEEPVEEVKEKIEETPEVVEEEKKPEVEEPKKEEPVVEEPVVEEPVEESKKEEPEEVVEDDNVKKIEEQLSVISEVRQELANSYSAHKEDVKTIEQLQSQIKSLKSDSKETIKTIEKLSSELDSYKAREEEATAVAYGKRLEQLSGRFEELGQKKTVEQLKELSEDVISEFESVTSMALNYKSEEKLDAVTTPTQATPQHKIVTKVAEKLSDKDFLKGVLNTLANQQNTQGADGKRILNM